MTEKWSNEGKLDIGQQECFWFSRFFAFRNQGTFDVQGHLQNGD